MSVALPPITSIGEVLDTAPCGFVSFADTGEIRLVNRTLGTMLGYDPEDLTGKNVETLLTVPTRIFYQTHFFPMLRLHGRAEEVFLTLKSAEGEQVHVLCNAVRVERDGDWVSECIVMRIHERHKFEDALVRARKAAEEANVARMRFLSMMSHDLRTPLNAISGYAELLLMGIRGEINAEQEKDLRRMKDASAYLLGLLNDVLSFVKFEAGQIEVSMGDVRLRDVLTQAEALVAPKLRETGIRYTSAECPDTVVVRADDARLQQVVLNLLTNAIKFTPGGSITLRCEDENGHVHIHITDTGPGIAPERLAWIFEPFTQLEQRSKAAQEGVGLGLSISRQLARAMGGDVTATSEPGKGSTFTITLNRT